MRVQQELVIDLDYIESGLKLYINSVNNNSMFIDDEADRKCEAEYQLIEGSIYEYEFNKNDFYLKDDNIIFSNKRRKNMGRILPNTYVGTIKFTVYKNNSESGYFEVEVQSVKADYRTDYRKMILDITNICTEIIMQSESPASHYFIPDYSKDNKSLFQKFEFVKSIISSEEFDTALQKILLSPVTSWNEINEKIDIRKAGKFTSNNIREIVSSSNRISISGVNVLNQYNINSIPERIDISKKIDSLDTPENRFIKYTIEEYISFCYSVISKASIDSRIHKEAEIIIDKLEGCLYNTFLKDITKPSLLALNSTILQKKEGYRELFRYWLMFDIASNLTWDGGNDIYSAGKKNVALLYEYWLYLSLVSILSHIFTFEKKSKQDLIKTSSNGFDLQLKQGITSSIKGSYKNQIKCRFCYNRVFNSKENEINGGSWSLTMRPDYTLTLWPYDLNENEAEEKNLIFHLHFDAKYKINNIQDITLDDNEDIRKDTSTFKNADILKMHAYKDGIRNSAGAFVLYPGTESVYFNESTGILPGIGVASVSPSSLDKGESIIKDIVLDFIKYLNNILEIIK